MSKTVQVWRLVKKTRVDTAFDGEGAFRFGGRWNNRGQRVVYASSTLALALLEILVHIDPMGYVPELVAIPIELPKSRIEYGPYSSMEQLNKGLPWSLSETRRVGDVWTSAAENLALQVPSSIIPLEHNYLINPSHPEFKNCAIGTPQELPLDARLLQA